MKISTWNVNSLKVRLEHVLQWLEQQDPDVLCLQETKTVDENFPADAFREAGYQVRFAGQKTYNGVATVSRTEPLDVVTGFPDYDDPQRRLLAATCGDVRIINVYIPNGSEVGSEKYAYKLEWLGHLLDFLAAETERHRHVVVTGDFNIAPADADVHDPEQWEGKILCSDAERDMFQRMINVGFSDTFRLFEQQPDMFSWWDYRQAAFRRNLGMRIDHILATAELSEICAACDIDKEPRKLERPSDHTPVFARFDL